MGKEESQYEGIYTVQDTGATSCATAVVSSLAGLIRSLRPDLDARTVIRIVKDSAVDISPEGFDESTGHGRVDFLAALRMAENMPKAPPATEP